MESLSFVIGKVLLFVYCLAYVELKPITPDADANPIMLIRLKRSPNKAFTFSGFNPNTGLSAFAASADFLPSFYRYAPAPPSPSSIPAEARESYLPSGESDSTYSYPPSVEYPSANSEDEEKKIPSENLTPPAETASNAGYNDDSNSVEGVKKPKKKPANPAQIQDEDAEENGSKSKSSSSASFNAWFPIVLGSYPKSSDGRAGSTVIANSVSNGKNGVASSHAILYAGGFGSESQSHVPANRRG